MGWQVFFPKCFLEVYLYFWRLCEGLFQDSGNDEKNSSNLLDWSIKFEPSWYRCKDRGTESTRRSPCRSQDGRKCEVDFYNMHSQTVSSKSQRSATFFFSFYLLYIIHVKLDLAFFFYFFIHYGVYMNKV